MRGGVTPLVLLFAALGLALAVAPRNTWPSSLLSLLTATGVFAMLPFPTRWLEGVFLGCWISVTATAASVHLVRGLRRPWALALSVNVGFWASAVASLSGSRLDLLKALPCVLLFAPASWVVRRYSSIPLKVVSSWLIAIAVLAAVLQLLPVTPGYLPDHLE